MPYQPARFLDLHVLQHAPASLMNRGEHNEPKTLVVGSVQRAALSPQSQKRAQRTDIEDWLSEHAVRTRMLPPRLSGHLTHQGWPKDLADFAAQQVARCATSEGLKTSARAGHRTEVMVYTAEQHLLDDLAQICTDHQEQLALALHHSTQKAADDADAGEYPAEEDDASILAASAGRRRKTAPAAAKRPSTPRLLPAKQIGAILARRTACIDLFGRMLAGHDESHVTGAVHLAWAFTTHVGDLQPDFFTAQEDWPADGDPGSAHLDTALLTSGVFYRYATVNLTQLTENTGGDLAHAQRLAELFMEAFLLSLPQAKRTSTAPHTLPDTAAYVVRDRRPVSYAPAFEQPVEAAAAGGFLAPSRQALADYAALATRMTGTRHRAGHGHLTLHPEPLAALGPHHPSYEEFIAAALTDAALTTSTPAAGAASPRTRRTKATA
ncbi:type I-E CRISPR-associated protein Cas7/Cse4/CasC [Streptomyces griseoluteus]|uniref:type I-E CRISPR-associated protein Cas7/Cse4/CasC n=1 Tax=Streptomyces griseoluteus TaxID=29306 RepID=UPI0036FF4738